ncbi:DUF2612 domain-containing protein [Rhizobium rhizogenes]|uniref:DUF2612 domain-containing protein n=1 Tax=Rhizobium rhizogenes TaxID=359 RepID=UPI0004DACAF2|nr:DUF2612 domain-containing protein [Rhizobium rhizogenes]KEA07112.1 hypothetical protein CN09_09115 [Rhizobium rhizogenes]NTI80467.1 DUF2612 domain-containing protein [Rhizobium rhizogenes]NTJ22653.1 DUF2612 domain-containing protein [Rhizobium rhizogenes]QUE81357.1 DUF2612 domain-containing protein [Rhizobium rhizogenes]TQO80548.1 DUF2612 domain-containing protein [Rhizobium rhizogenes]
MSGPDYPPGPQPGSNGVGLFTIGVSPIGTIPPFDVWKTVISQYANSPILIQLIENVFVYLDQTKNFDAFFDYIWSVDTAQGYGLDVWGRIVGVNRVLQVEVGNWFGYEESLPGAFTFGQGAFFSGSPLTDNFSLSDQAFRQLIFAKAAANITNGSIPAINRILMTLFPNRGNAYVTDGFQGGDWFGFSESVNAQGFNQASYYSGSTITTMTMTYTFEFQLSPVELAIVQNSGVLPKPTGVSASVVTL